MPEQVSEHWEVIKYAIEESLPPISLNSPNTLNNVLIKLMSGEMVCWMAYDSDKKVMGFAVTTVVEDSNSETKSLLLYTIYAYEKTKGIDWIEAYESLSKYALSRDCINMVGYTRNDKLIKIAEKFDSDSTYRFVSFPI